MHFSEDDLRSALKRKDPGAGFTQRVMERIKQAQARNSAPPRVRTSFLQLWWPLKLRMAMAVAVVAILAVAAWLGVARYRAVQEQRAGEQAKEQAILALRIANAKLNHVFERVKASQPRDMNIRRERL